MIIDTMTMKVTKNGYAAYDPQSPPSGTPPENPQSRIGRPLVVRGDPKQRQHRHRERFELACSSAPPRRVDPNVNTPTYA